MVKKKRKPPLIKRLAFSGPFLLEKFCDRGEFRRESFVESPEGGFLANGGGGGQVAVDEGEFGVFDVEIEGIFDEAFVATDIFEARNKIDASDDFFYWVFIDFRENENHFHHGRILKDESFMLFRDEFFGL